MEERFGDRCWFVQTDWRKIFCVPLGRFRCPNILDCGHWRRRSQVRLPVSSIWKEFFLISSGVGLDVLGSSPGVYTIIIVLLVRSKISSLGPGIRRECLAHYIFEKFTIPSQNIYWKPRWWNISIFNNKCGKLQYCLKLWSRLPNFNGVMWNYTLIALCRLTQKFLNIKWRCKSLRVIGFFTNFY